MDDLLQEFIAETRETLEALSGEIVAWEANPDDKSRLDAIFRFVHTVKGSCGFLDLPRLARLSHAAEDALAQVRCGERTPDTGLVNAVLAVVDRIGEIVEAIDSGESLDDTGEDLLIAALAEGTDMIAAAPAGVGGQRAPARSVRLNVDLLDRMMSGMSDMVLARNELARRMREGNIDPALEAALERLSLTVGEMRDTVTRTRMQKIDALFSALPRMVRDTAAGLGKSVTLHVEGSDVELDREMIEMMRDPLVHIVRNSIDHGIELPAARRNSGKRENGRLNVSARQSGNQIIIEISDDGRGIDTEKLIAKMVQNGGDERQLRALSDRGKLELVFEPGLSSKDEVSEISGRGVGMDVVRAAIEQIGGRVELDNNPGKGLRIAIHVPLTLSIISAIVVGAGGQRFAIPRQAIEEIVTDGSDAIRIDTIGGVEVLTVRERRMPMLNLCDVLGIEPARSESRRMIAIVSVPEGSYALGADTVLDTEELVIKPASPAVMSCGVYAGQTLPDSGMPMLLLDCAGLASVAGLDFSSDGSREMEEEAAEAASPGIPALLFQDLDGVRRAVPLAAVDRVEQVDAVNVRFAAGRFRVTIDGRILPLAAQGEIQGRDRLNVLRLKDDANEISYAINEAIDIIVLPEDVTPAREAGPVSGVALLDGEQVELLDVLWVFDTHADRDGMGDEERPVCLIQGDEGGWMASFVRPLLETSGYRVAFELAPGETASVVLSSDDAPPALAEAAPVVRLRRRRVAAGAGDDSVYRYDRAGLLRALQAKTGKR
ncbi:chemotaxis protein CheA [Sphingomonas soli]|uniref:chemotaxis protein CheA n=1 Tax=Sphingomonas soli TaxID=266127 RepID=UPI000831A503|nr:chemotaxis protein CheW [Sphingomonas soli]